MLSVHRSIPFRGFVQLAAFHSGMTSSGPDDIVAVDISGSLAVYSGNPSTLSYFIGAPVAPSISGGTALDWSGV